MTPRRILRGTGLEVPVIGFGVSGPHGAWWTAAWQVDQLIGEMLDGGAALFDTAPFYGRAERRLGAALSRRGADHALVCTKGGTIRRGRQVLKDFTADGLRRSLAGSLADLGRARADLFLLHGPDPALAADSALARAVEQFKADGAAGLIGVCARGRPTVEAFAKASWVDVIQAPVWPDADGFDAAECAAAHGKAFLGIEALRPSVKMRLPLGPADLWYNARLLRDRATRRTATEPVSAAEALARALSRPGVDAIVVTTSRLLHARSNLAIAAAALRSAGGDGLRPAAQSGS